MFSCQVLAEKNQGTEKLPMPNMFLEGSNESEPGPLKGEAFDGHVPARIWNERNQGTLATPAKFWQN